MLKSKYRQRELRSQWGILKAITPTQPPPLKGEEFMGNTNRLRI